MRRRRRPLSLRYVSFEERAPSIGLSRILLFLGVMLVGVGLWMLPSTAWWHRHVGPLYEVVDIKDRDHVGNLGFSSRFPVERLTTYRLGGAKGLDVPISVAEYRNESGLLEHATVFLQGIKAATSKASNPRMDLWTMASEAILNHASPDAIYLTWWDNAQRIHFLTGEATAIRLPAEKSFQDSPLAGFWKEVAGDYAKAPDSSLQLAQWLTMDAESALRDLRTKWPNAKPIYLFGCVDDLARLSEIERLSGVKIPIEARYFPEASDLHAQIKEVRRWANEMGEGANYLVQPVSGGGVHAWRVTSPEASRLLLIRLLPFSKSLETPLEGVRLVYQSLWGAYISIHEVIPAAP